MNSSRNNKLVINLIATIVQMLLNYCISLLFTPYIVLVVGGEANGFVSLANSIVNYVTIVTIALNSVAGRYITISVHKNSLNEANEYFNSVLLANIILTSFVGIVFVPIIINLQNIFDIPASLVSDVKMLFVFVVLNFMITVATNVFTVGTFITNKLYLSNIGNCISSIIRVLILFFMFGIFPVNIAYVGLAAVFSSFVLAIYNIVVTKKLDIGLKIKFSNFSLVKIKEMLISGIWSSVTKLSQVLSDGLDMLISNLWVSSYAMGQLSIAYTIPTLLASVLSQISSLFNPQQTYFYAKGDIKSVVKEIRTNMMLTGYLISIIFAGIITFGYEFFSLWVPNENIKMIYVLAVLSIISVLISGVSSSLSSVFLITDHLKVNSLVWLAVSCFDAIVVIILVNVTELGVYAVAGVSKIVGLIINMTYTPIYACKCLGISPKTFYPMIFKYIGCSIMLIVVMQIINCFFPTPDSWSMFIGECLIAGFVGCIMNYFLLLNSEERYFLINKIRRKDKSKKEK